jgi:hypothetical protein
MGVFNLSEQELESYNPDMSELLSLAGSRTERELIHYDSIITVENLGEAITGFAARGSFPSSFVRSAAALLTPFITANVIFPPTIPASGSPRPESGLNRWSSILAGDNGSSKRDLSSPMIT